jgi:lipoprotein-anchoring transpeptidase ErfK/SrfK
MKTTTMLRRLSASLLAASIASAVLASTAGAQYSATYPTATPPAAAAAAPTTMLEVEQKLAALRYDVGPADGVTDVQTTSAIMAFQKVHGLERTGGLTHAVTAQIMATQSPPPALAPNGEPNRIEISLARQVLFLYEGGALTKILPVSSGTSETPTPTGTFRIFRQESGWHTSRLGRLHNAQYFIGGYAIHGSNSVPAEPASHGCVRIPMTASEWFPSHVSKGMQVVILEG